MKKTISRLRCGFYYGLLSIDEMVLYKKIGMAVGEMAREVALRNLDKKILGKVFMAIQYDNAEFFYWESQKSYVKDSILYLVYRFGNKEDTIETLEKIRGECKKIITAIEGTENFHPKEVLRGVYMVLKESVELGDVEEMRPECSRWLYDIEGVFLKKKASCLGISLAFHYICEKLHFPSCLITGTLNVIEKEVSHGWNLACIDGRYFHFDLTEDIKYHTQGCPHYFMISSDGLMDRKWSKKIYERVLT